MIFASYEFLLAFLPATWGVFVLLKFTLARWANALNSNNLKASEVANTLLILWLLLASFVFYADWRLDHLFLLWGVIGGNVFLANLSYRYPRRWLLLLAVCCNLGLLFYYKYQPLVNGDTTRSVLLAGMPLGISFYVFQVVAYQIDQWRAGARPANALHFSLFLSFFPQLIAGPIVHGRQLLPQLSRLFERRLHISLGFVMLTLGLAKKVLIADTFAPGVEAIYAGQYPWDTVVSLAAAFGYGAQLYFDFSGYADMAVGLALLFGLKLPQNFRRPYTAVNISDFWRRWHITLSTFLRDYLYIALGGNRFGLPRQLLALIATMALGGIWHGAGWQFLAWGLGHGLLLAGWHFTRRLAPAVLGWIPGWLAWFTTLFLVMLLWIPFRAPTLDSALDMLSGLIYWQGVSLTGFAHIPEHVALLSTMSATPSALLLLAIVSILAVSRRPTAWRWALSASVPKRVACATLLCLAVFKALADRPEQPFLYFQF